MYNDLDYLYGQLNELNSKIGNIYSYIDNNNLTNFKMRELYFKADNYCSRADKIQARIDLIENNKNGSKFYTRLILIYSIIIAIIVIIAILTI